MINILHVYGITTELNNIKNHEKIYKDAQINKYLCDSGVEGYKLTTYIKKYFDYEFPANFIVKITESDSSEILSPNEEKCHPMVVFIGFVVDKIYTFKEYNTGMPPYPEPCGLYTLRQFNICKYREKLGNVLDVILRHNDLNLPDKDEIMVDFINQDQQFRNLEGYI